MKVNKILKRNDQRDDPPSPVWKTLGWAQCMGNTFQNIANWVGVCYPEQFGDFSKTNTFSYYAGFETWLKQLWFDKEKKYGRLPTDEKFKKWVIDNQSENKISDFHAKYLNELFKKNGVPLEITVVRPGSKKELIAALSEEMPCGIGTQITPDGHIVTGMEYDSEKDVFKTSDSFGNGNTEYKDHNGFDVPYTWEFMKPRALYVIKKKVWK